MQHAISRRQTRELPFLRCPLPLLMVSCLVGDIDYVPVNAARLTSVTSMRVQYSRTEIHWSPYNTICRSLLLKRVHIDYVI